MQNNLSTGEKPEMCPVCASAGMRYSLRLFQINFEEAVSMCENPECTYPTWEQEPVIQARNACDLPLAKVLIGPKSGAKPGRLRSSKHSDSDSAISTNSGSSYASWCSTVSNISDASSLFTSKPYPTPFNLRTSYPVTLSPASSVVSLTDREVEQLTQANWTTNTDVFIDVSDSNSSTPPFISQSEFTDQPSASTGNDYDFLDAIVAEVVGERYQISTQIPSQESAFSTYSVAPFLPAATSTSVLPATESLDSSAQAPSTLHSTHSQPTLPILSAVKRPTPKSTASHEFRVAPPAKKADRTKRPSTAPPKVAPPPGKRQPKRDSALVFDLNSSSKSEAATKSRTPVTKKRTELPLITPTAKGSSRSSSSINLLSRGLRTAKSPSVTPKPTLASQPLTFRILTPESDSGIASGESSPVPFTNECFERVRSAGAGPAGIRKLRINVTLNNLRKKGLIMQPQMQLMDTGSR